MFSRLPKTPQQLLSAQRWKTRVVFWSGAVAIGLASAGFAKAAAYVDHLFHEEVVSRSIWLPLIVTPVGLVLVAWITRNYLRGTEGSGIPQAIAALQSRHEPHRGALLSFRIAIGKIVLTLIGLISGASIGREGTTVHVGAAIMFSIGRFAHFPRHDIERGLILAGSAAGISAAFNTPLAGILFAIEEMSKSFEEQTSGTLLVAVMISGVMALAVLGNYSYFGTAEATMGQLYDWIAVPVVGVAGGALGGLMGQILVTGNRRLRPVMATHPLLVAAACGLVVAVAGVLSGGSVFGTGYDAAKHIIDGGQSSYAYPFLKMLATVASYLSGIPGGIFAPSLSAGAGLGNVLSPILPGVAPTIVVILAMVAFFSGVVGTPITAFVIVMEMTSNQTMLLPLMATSFIAFGVSRIINPQPIYHALAEAFFWQPSPEDSVKAEKSDGQSAKVDNPPEGTDIQQEKKGDD